MEETEDFKELRAKALAQLRSGQLSTGKDDAFAPLLKQFLEEALKAEMKVHLDEQKVQYENEINATIQQCFKAPSIIMWVLFNEEWMFMIRNALLKN